MLMLPDVMEHQFGYANGNFRSETIMFASLVCVGVCVCVCDAASSFWILKSLPMFCQ